MTFTMKEETARLWLAQQADAADEGGDYDLLIQADWEPRMTDPDDSIVYQLLAEARDADVIVSTANYELNYVFADDSDGGMYFFTVDIWDSSLRLASQYQELRRLGDPDTKGIDAAVSILKEAVSFGNEMLSSLAKYVTEHS